ncbi:MAG: DUF4097 family beta strand repeat protein [Clostridia bacterium]|nr:DUF4097 family beta strand repeat protein [Clostridia bacterium]
MKKAAVLAAILLIAGLALVCGALASVGFEFRKLGTAELETNTYEIDEAFSSIQIKVNTADVTLAVSGDGTCRVVCRESKKAPHTVTAENGTLRISSSRERTDVFDLCFEKQTVTVYLPKNMYETISIETSTGDVTIEALSAGTIACTVSTGHVRMRNVACTGDVTIGISTGKTDLEGLTCRDLQSRGSTGDVVLQDVLANGRISIERSTGDVTFRNSDAAEIRIRTSTGDVTGTLRTEKVFAAKSTTGDIRVPDSVSGGKCEITTGTGDIEMMIADGNGRR